MKRITTIGSKKKAMPRESPRVRVLRWLEHAISSGEFPRGSDIPSERAIAMLLDVAPNTAAAAMDEALAHPEEYGRKAGEYVRSETGATDKIYNALFNN